MAIAEYIFPKRTQCLERNLAPQHNDWQSRNLKRKKGQEITDRVFPISMYLPDV